jgi:hypothetical protein
MLSAPGRALDGGRQRSHTVTLRSSSSACGHLQPALRAGIRGMVWGSPPHGQGKRAHLQQAAVCTLALPLSQRSGPPANQFGQAGQGLARGHAAAGQRDSPARERAGTCCGAQHTREQRARRYQAACSPQQEPGLPVASVHVQGGPMGPRLIASRLTASPAPDEALVRTRAHKRELPASPARSRRRAAHLAKPHSCPPTAPRMGPLRAGAFLGAPLPLLAPPRPDANAGVAIRHHNCATPPLSLSPCSLYFAHPYNPTPCQRCCIAVKANQSKVHCPPRGHLLRLPSPPAHPPIPPSRRQLARRPGKPSAVACHDI